MNYVLKILVIILLSTAMLSALGASAYCVFYGFSSEASFGFGLLSIIFGAGLMMFYNSEC